MQQELLKYENSKKLINQFGLKFKFDLVNSENLELSLIHNDNRVFSIYIPKIMLFNYYEEYKKENPEINNINLALFKDLNIILISYISSEDEFYKLYNIDSEEKASAIASYYIKTKEASNKFFDYFEESKALRIIELLKFIK